MEQPNKVLIVSEHASMTFGGEASLPWHYFVRLRQRGVEAWLVVHSRTREEIERVLPEALDHIHFIPDTGLNVLAWKLSRYMPAQLSYITVGYASRLSTQLTARKIVRKLVRENNIDVVHQPIPVSPREPSIMSSLGAPVVIGPMNGNMRYPPAFEKSSRSLRVLSSVLGYARKFSEAMHSVMRGKREAAFLLVANERTRLGLPHGCRGQVVTLVENGIDTGLWKPRSYDQPAAQGTRFVFMGRLVDWKAVDILLEAMHRIRDVPGCRLDIIGDGDMRPTLEAQARNLGLTDRVTFLGFQSQEKCASLLAQSDALVLSSLYECGGAVVLEAMASGLPVVATAWGGPADYLDPSCGILVEPTSRETLISGFADAMRALANDPALRQRLGTAAYQKALSQFDWEEKVDQMQLVYRAASQGIALGETRLSRKANDKAQTANSHGFS
ncbi:glycosyltransferase family 4 protein [Aureimonas fodinaquatilis]|uniref:Glycosyltransferase family 4 protein n=2 Tax=Aureimonas fodinaquatilis TaxID=2565783 RepID=A0A5B0DWN9_9HYPH|nr:glycosyltransferase family 4 protein [Aureimonas fodinaquatilis]